MIEDKEMPLKIYKNGELVAQFSIVASLLHKDWIRHYKSHYPESKITEEKG